MIEASASQQSIGSLITLEAQQLQQDAGQPLTSGKQSIQTGTSPITRRIIHLATDCNQFVSYRKSSDTSVQGIRIKLSRLTRRFAHKRIVRSLEKWCADHNNDMSTLELYAIYQRYCPAPTITESYPAWKSAQAAREHLPLRLESIAWQWNKLLTVLRIGDNGILDLPQRVETPFVLLVEDSAIITQALEQFLAGIHHDHKQNVNSVQLWYSDHEHINKQTKPVHPCFKPGWNRGLLLHGNYVGALLLCRSNLFERTGGIDIQAGSSAIYDFLLRSSRWLNHDNVVRVPQMLYQLPESNYRPPHGFCVRDHDRWALQRHLHNQKGLSAVLADGPFDNTFSVKFQLGNRVPSVEIIIPTRDRVDLLERCVKSILCHTEYPEYQITVVDNDSQEPSTAIFYKSLSANTRFRKIDHSGIFNYSAINNRAVERSRADIVVLLNNDTEITQGNWLYRMVSEAWQSDIACVGARLLYPNGLLQHAGLIVGMQGIAGHVNRFASPSNDGYAGSTRFSADYCAVTAACLAVRRLVFKQLGGLDEKNLPIAYNDVDFCLRALKAGYRNRLLADITVIHHESVSRGADATGASKVRFAQEKQFMRTTHPEILKNDPAWNPNFLSSFSTPSLPEKSIRHTPLQDVQAA